MADARIRETLEARLAALTRRLGKVERDLRQQHDPDSQERSTERENDEVLEHLDSDARREIGEFHLALERLERGTYGVCGSCGEAIDAQRLAALPCTASCIACAAG